MKRSMNKIIQKDNQVYMKDRMVELDFYETEVEAKYENDGAEIELEDNLNNIDIREC